MGISFLFRWLVIFPVVVGILGSLAGRVLDTMCPAGRWIRRIWSGLPHFVQNLMIGTLIASMVHLGHWLSWVREMDDLAVDWMNRLQVDTAWLNASKGIGYVFLDMDEASFAAWNEPFHVPRDHLARLIRYAKDGGARAIVVDVDLSRRGADPEADGELLDLIEGYPAQAPDLILFRTASPASSADRSLLQWRGTCFDASRLSAAVHFVHPRYTKDQVDLRLRRWHLVEPGCREGHPLVLPSVQLLMAVLLRSGRAGWQDVRAQLAANGPHDCSGETDGHHGESPPLRYGDRIIHTDAQGIDQRVIYAYSDSPGGSKPPEGLERISAVSLLKHLSDASFDPVRGRVVVIGASYEASRDLHATPVGRMPGALVLLNAIKSLNQFGQLHGPPKNIVLLIEAVLIVVMAWLFARLGSWRATLVTGTLTILILVPATFWWFRYGVWIGLAAPILGMQLHQAFASWEESQAHRNSEPAPSAA